VKIKIAKCKWRREQADIKKIADKLEKKEDQLRKLKEEDEAKRI